MAERSYTARAAAYAKSVVTGKIPACKWVKAACQRQIDDLERWKGKNAPYRFDKPAAEKFCRFMENLPHIKGEWAKRRDSIKLEDHQCFQFTTVFGWLKPDGNRRFRTAYIEKPRKNAKSTESCGVGLYLFAADGEAGAEVYSAATTRDQAKIVFSDAQAMARREPGFRKKYGVEVGAHNIHILGSASKFEALSAEANSLEGLNIHGAIIDELHAHKTRAVWSVLDNATGARKQSLIWAITTAGSNRAGVCYEQRTYVTKILNSVLSRHPEFGEVRGDRTDDESYYGIIYTIDDDDDWTDPVAHRKANPNYDISVSGEDLTRLCRQAQSMASAQNDYLNKRLNVWTNADTGWMNMIEWDRCADPTLDIADFEGQTCYMGLDLATTTDIAAKVLVFPRGKEVCIFGRYYLPDGAVERSPNKSAYAGWEVENRFVIHDGGSLDFDLIKDDILEDCRRFNVKQVRFDPFQAHYLRTELEKTSLKDKMVQVDANVRNYSDPMKQIEALVVDKRLKHNGDPVMTWMMSNVVCHRDAKDNIYPRKEQDHNKIDGPVALISGIGGLPLGQSNSVYADRGLLYI